LKVLHVHSGNLYGGVETFLRTLASYRSLEPTMQMSVALCFHGQISRELRTAGVPVMDLGIVRLRNPPTIWRARRTLADLLKRDRYDAVVCHQAWPHAIFGPVVKTARVPLVLWIHTAGTGRHWLDRLARRVTPDLIVCNSRFTASTLTVSAPKIEVVYYPVGRPNADTDPSHRDVTRAELNTASDAVVIIQVSRMEPLKGQRVCIAALGQLKHIDRWTCWQIGGAQQPSEVRYLESLKQQAEEQGIVGRVRFAGHRSDVSRLLRAADIFCQPNISPDAFGISFVEAMSAGLPVVTSAIGGAPEVIDSSCGVLVERNNPASVAAALLPLVTDRSARQNLGLNGPDRARMLCDPAVQMPKIAAVLESVVSQGITC
jgi:glycosyltransferase involved in cell wall biosynthesis